MVVVLLNPGIFKRRDGKGFNLRMNENKTPLSRQQNASVKDVDGGESVLEVGFARDWAGCDALKADGTVCGDWVDTRHTKICAYHVDHQLKRARTNRQEYNVG
jgi:minichromosome maintenance protein 10